MFSQDHISEDQLPELARAELARVRQQVDRAMHSGHTVAAVEKVVLFIRTLSRALLAWYAPMAEGCHLVGIQSGILAKVGVGFEARWVRLRSPFSGQQFSKGYMYVRPDGQGASFHSELPADVRDRDVYELPVIETTTLRQILAVYSLVLDGLEVPGELFRLASGAQELSQRAFLATSHGAAQQLWRAHRAALRHAGLSTALTDAFAQFRYSIGEAWGSGSCQGVVLSAVLIVDRMHQIFSGAGDEQQAVRLIGQLAVSVGRPPKLPDLAAQQDAVHLAAWALRQGHGAADVARAAESLADDADDFRDRALDACSYEAFYEGLQEASPRYGAALTLYQVLESSEPSMTRWAKRANVVEESHVRILTSLVMAVDNVDQGKFRKHRKLIEEARQRGGEEAARLEAIGFIESCLFYPRGLLPYLLGQT